jgi:hypothetical protein
MQHKKLSPFDKGSGQAFDKSSGHELLETGKQELT